MGEIPRAEPGATPRVGFAGDAVRGRPVFKQSTELGRSWSVEVVPLEGVDPGRAQKARATFEVRAEFEGQPLAEFEPVDGLVNRVETWTCAELERAQAVAIAAVDELRAGRDPVLVLLAGRFADL